MHRNENMKDSSSDTQDEDDIGYEIDLDSCDDGSGYDRGGGHGMDGSAGGDYGGGGGSDCGGGGGAGDSGHGGTIGGNRSGDDGGSGGVGTGGGGSGALGADGDGRGGGRRGGRRGDDDYIAATHSLERIILNMMFSGEIPTTNRQTLILPPKLFGSGFLAPEFRRFPKEIFETPLSRDDPPRPTIPHKYADTFPSFLLKPSVPPSKTNNNANTSTINYGPHNPANERSYAEKAENNSENVGNRSSIIADSRGTSQMFFIDFSRWPEQVSDHLFTDNTVVGDMLFDVDQAANKKRAMNTSSEIESPKRDLAKQETAKPGLTKQDSGKQDSAKQYSVKLKSEKKDLSSQTPTAQELVPRYIAWLEANNKSSNSHPRIEVNNVSTLETFCDSNNDRGNLNPSSNTKNDSLISSAKHQLKKKSISGNVQTRSKTTTCDMFLKLSDLGQPSTSSVNIQERVRDPRMSRSIPDSVALSLNKLLPHLSDSKYMSDSVLNRSRSPVTMGACASPGGVDEYAPDACNNCSTTESSMPKEGREGEEKCLSLLGQDELHMFLEKITPDVIIEVDGRRIKAHKCILSSRCPYFASIFSAGWSGSNKRIISLRSFHYDEVHLALCHIYTGSCAIPESANLLELTRISNLLRLEGLKEAIVATLKTKYCHEFHKPCPVCLAGVVECYKMCGLYGLEELATKCMIWINRHIMSAWPTRSFAMLPSKLMERCYEYVANNIMPKNPLRTVSVCGIVVGALGSSPWTHTVLEICRRMLGKAAQIISVNLLENLKCLETLSSKQPGHAKFAIDECLRAAINQTDPEAACCAYDYLDTIVKDILSEEYGTPDILGNDVPAVGKVKLDTEIAYQAAVLFQYVEDRLVRAAPELVTTQAFRELRPELRMKIRNLGNIKYGSEAIPYSPTHETPFNINPTASTSNIARTSIVPSTSTVPSTSIMISTYAESTSRYTGIESLGSSNCSAFCGPGNCTGARNNIRTANTSWCNGDKDLAHTAFAPSMYDSTVVGGYTAGYCPDSPPLNQGMNYFNASGQSQIQTTKAQEERTKCKSGNMPDTRGNKTKEQKRRANRKLGPQLCSSSESSLYASPVLARRERVSRVQARDRQSLPQACQDSSPPHTAGSSTGESKNSQHANDTFESRKSKCLVVIQATSKANKKKTKTPLKSEENTNTNCSDMKPNECGNGNSENERGVSGLSTVRPMTSTSTENQKKIERVHQTSLICNQKQ